MGFTAIIYNIYVYYNQQAKRDMDLSKPLECEKAILVSKSLQSNKVYYELVFELDSGERKKFVIQKNAAPLICEGDNGKLEYKGDTFVNFTRSISSDSK